MRPVQLRFRLCFERIERETSRSRDLHRRHLLVLLRLRRDVVRRTLLGVPRRICGFSRVPVRQLLCSSRRIVCPALCISGFGFEDVRRTLRPCVVLSCRKISCFLRVVVGKRTRHRKRVDDAVRECVHIQRTSPIDAAGEDLVREIVVRDSARRADRCRALAPSDRASEVCEDGVRLAFERDLSHLARLRSCQRFRRQNGGAIDRDAARPLAAQIGGHAFKSCLAGLSGAVGNVRRHIPIAGFYIQFRARHMRCGADIDRACHRVTRDAQRAADGSGRRVRPCH